MQSIKPEDRDQWTVDCLFKQISRLQSTLPVFLSSVSSPVNSPFCESSVLSFCSAHSVATSKVAVIFTGRLKRGNYGSFCSPNIFKSDFDNSVRLKDCLS